MNAENTISATSQRVTVQNSGRGVSSAKRCWAKKEWMLHFARRSRASDFGFWEERVAQRESEFHAIAVINDRHHGERSSMPLNFERILVIMAMREQAIDGSD